MPANFGEIAEYHSRIAARYLALAQAARDEGNLAEAHYRIELAARYIQAAEEQRIVMRQESGPSIAPQSPRLWSPEAQQSARPAPARLQAVLHGAGQIASAIRQYMVKRNEPFHGLSLH